MLTPGTVTLIGSGETAATGGQVFEITARQYQPPLHVSILETPAGFETNARRVAGRVAEFLSVRLQNYAPELHLISAHKKGTAFSPDSADVVEPLYTSQMIFFGPGSPTYTVRQLQNSLAWSIIQARQRAGASVILASAATIAISKTALPVYEIFKVGEDPYWKTGLDLLGPYGLPLVVIPHWNNREGGDEVDTSRCFIGQERFEFLQGLLPEDTTVLGIDEHTALTIDFAAHLCYVRGVGQIHLISRDHRQDCSAGCSFPIYDLGPYQEMPDPSVGIPEDIWQRASAPAQSETGEAAVPPEVQELVDARQQARQQKEWARADQLRAQITNRGWQVKDSPDGPIVSPLE